MATKEKETENEVETKKAATATSKPSSGTVTPHATAAAKTFKVGPVTRIEGHLDIEVTVDQVNGQMQVVDAKCEGTMFRGFENILLNRDPRDAVHLTQRICGVCPVSHAMASSMALEQAFRITPTENGRVMRNLILGANFIQSHILHFYHLAAPDYIDTTGILDMSPWTPRYTTSDMAKGATAQSLVNNYLTALAMRRKAHQMGAIFGGKLPHTPTFSPGGCSEIVSADKVTAFRALLTELRNFLTNTMVPDALAVASLFPAYKTIGRGSGNLLAYGVFDLSTTNTNNKLLARGRVLNGQLQTVSATSIKEYVKYGYYSSATGLNPATGATTPSPAKAGAYSWLKAPRYDNAVYEVGPLARMWVNGDYRNGPSVIDRVAARALEAQKIADAMDGWLNQLVVGGQTCRAASVPASGTGIGLTEAARGALGHWVEIRNSKLSRYQVITPTAWNASPKDDSGQMGAMEQALMGTPVADTTQPIELLRVVHSFDPCLACAVHLLRPGQKRPKVVLRA